jgi:hypothetical protein
MARTTFKERLWVAPGSVISGIASLVCQTTMLNFLEWFCSWVWSNFEIFAIGILRN